MIGNPLPSFEGEPKLVEALDNMEEFADLLWNSLNEENKVSLFVRYIDIETGNYETKIVNKNKIRSVKTDERIRIEIRM